VRIVPAVPTATKVLLPKVTPEMSSMVPDTSMVPVTPSGELRIVPAVPTATNLLLPNVAPNKGFPCGRGFRHSQARGTAAIRIFGERSRTMKIKQNPRVNILAKFFFLFMRTPSCNYLMLLFKVF
jgi:hypothetical protein